MNLLGFKYEFTNIQISQTIVTLLKTDILLYLNLTFRNTFQTWAYYFNITYLYELVNEKIGQHQ